MQFERKNTDFLKVMAEHFVLMWECSVAFLRRIDGGISPRSVEERDEVEMLNDEVAASASQRYTHMPDNSATLELTEMSKELQDMYRRSRGGMNATKATRPSCCWY